MRREMWSSPIGMPGLFLKMMTSLRMFGANIGETGISIRLNLQGFVIEKGEITARSSENSNKSILECQQKDTKG